MKSLLIRRVGVVFYTVIVFIITFLIIKVWKSSGITGVSILFAAAYEALFFTFALCMLHFIKGIPMKDSANAFMATGFSIAVFIAICLAGVITLMHNQLSIIDFFTSHSYILTLFILVTAFISAVVPTNVIIDVSKKVKIFLVSAHGVLVFIIITLIKAQLLEL
jgi:hypothetical protein